jgi:HEAT repeat protein
MSEAILQTGTVATTLLLLITPFSAVESGTDGGAKAAREVLARFEKGHPDFKTHVEGLAELVKIGPTAVPVLVEALQRESPAARAFAAQVLAILADGRARPALQEALSDATPQVRAYAAYGLSMLGPIDPTLEPYRTVLEKDPDPRVRQAAAWALERDDGPAVAALMRERLNNYNVSTWDTARLDEPAPEFALIDAAGKTYRLRDFRGNKPVVLKFYHEPL